MAGIKQQTTNTFNGGMIKDMAELATPNNSLVDCLNGTILTFNGNEFVLQNDMGNAIVEHCRLKPDFIPLGVKEYGGIIYIASVNPFTGVGEIGSFPSPQRIINASDSTQLENSVSLKDLYEVSIEERKETNDKGEIVTIKEEVIATIENEKHDGHDNVYQLKNSHLVPIDKLRLNPGDKFYLSTTKLPSDIYFTTTKFRRVFKVNLVVVSDGGDIEYISNNNLFDNYLKESGVNFDSENLKETKYNIFTSKRSGYLAYLFEQEKPDSFNLNFNVRSQDKDRFKLIVSSDYTFSNVKIDNEEKTNRPTDLYIKCSNEKSSLCKYEQSYDEENDSHTIGTVTGKIESNTVFSELDKIQTYTIDAYVHSDFTTFPELSYTETINYEQFISQQQSSVFKYYIDFSSEEVRITFNFIVRGTANEKNSCDDLYIQFYDVESNRSVIRKLLTTNGTFSISMPLYTSIESDPWGAFDSEEFEEIKDVLISSSSNISYASNPEVCLKPYSYYIIKLIGTDKYYIENQSSETKEAIPNTTQFYTAYYNLWTNGEFNKFYSSEVSNFNSLKLDSPLVLNNAYSVQRGNVTLSDPIATINGTDTPYTIKSSEILSDTTDAENSSTTIVTTNVLVRRDYKENDTITITPELSLNSRFKSRFGIQPIGRNITLSENLNVTIDEENSDIPNNSENGIVETPPTFSLTCTATENNTSITLNTIFTASKYLEYEEVFNPRDTQYRQPLVELIENKDAILKNTLAPYSLMIGARNDRFSAYQINTDYSHYDRCLEGLYNDYNYSTGKFEKFSRITDKGSGTRWTEYTDSLQNSNLDVYSDSVIGYFLIEYHDWSSGTKNEAGERNTVNIEDNNYPITFVRYFTWCDEKGTKIGGSSTIRPSDYSQNEQSPRFKAWQSSKRDTDQASPYYVHSDDDYIAGSEIYIIVRSGNRVYSIGVPMIAGDDWYESNSNHYFFSNGFSNYPEKFDVIRHIGEKDSETRMINTYRWHSKLDSYIKFRNSELGKLSYNSINLSLGGKLLNDNLYTTTLQDIKENEIVINNDSGSLAEIKLELAHNLPTIELIYSITPNIDKITVGTSQIHFNDVIETLTAPIIGLDKLETDGLKANAYNVRLNYRAYDNTPYGIDHTKDAHYAQHIGYDPNSKKLTFNTDGENSSNFVYGAWLSSGESVKYIREVDTDSVCNEFLDLFGGTRTRCTSAVN